MKVLHILTDTNIGGAGTCGLTLVKRLNGPECQIEVILPENSALKPEFEKLGVKVTEAGFIGDRSFDLRAVAGLWRLVREKKPDIVHTHAALSGRVAARLAGRCGIVCTRHSVYDVPERNRRFPRRQAIGFVNNFFSGAIIAVSPAARDNLTAVGTDPKKIHVIMNGAEPVAALTDAEKAAIRREYGIGGGDFVVTAAARLVSEKGHGTVLDAARIIAAKTSGGMPEGKRLRLLFAGAGPEEARLREKAAAEEIPGVIFAGFVKDIGRIYNITDLMVNASYGTEATSIALLEGMSLGIPAAASAFGGNPWVVRNGVNGLLFPKKDAEKLAESILSLCRDEILYDKMAKDAREIYEAEFTAGKMAERTLALYNSLVNRLLP